MRLLVRVVVKFDTLVVVTVELAEEEVELPVAEAVREEDEAPPMSSNWML